MFGYFGIYPKPFPSETVLITSYFHFKPVTVQFLILLKNGEGKYGVSSLFIVTEPHARVPCFT